MSEGARGYITAIKDAPAGSWLWPRLFFFFNYDPPLSCGDRGAGDTEGWVFSASDGGGAGPWLPGPAPRGCGAVAGFLDGGGASEFFFFFGSAPSQAGSVCFSSCFSSLPILSISAHRARQGTEGPLTGPQKRFRLERCRRHRGHPGRRGVGSGVSPAMVTLSGTSPPETSRALGARHGRDEVTGSFSRVPSPPLHGVTGVRERGGQSRRPPHWRGQRACPRTSEGPGASHRRPRKRSQSRRAQAGRQSTGRGAGRSRSREAHVAALPPWSGPRRWRRSRGLIQTKVSTARASGAGLVSGKRSPHVTVHMCVSLRVSVFLLFLISRSTKR